MRLRALTPGDWQLVLALNRASVRELSELDERRLEWIVSLAHVCLVLESGGEVVAFTIAIGPDTDYDSVNYRWFQAWSTQFLYLDRIVVTAAWRRRGLATRLYDAAEATAESYGRMVCDVNVTPPNPASLAFHAARGYVEVGRLPHHGQKVVALLSKEFPGHVAQIERG
jgi:uncharacterized protein